MLHLRARAGVLASVGRLLLVGSLPLSGIGALQAQQPDTAKVIRLQQITVTATRTPKPVFQTPRPVNVVDSATIREEAPNTAADLFRNLPGADVTGVGTNQSRLLIRGERGQRILLLEDGMRLSNSRRQQDFGEIPAIVDVEDVSRVEVVRGPSSVLYGSDAIGGVANFLTLRPPTDLTGNEIHGRLGFRYSDFDSQKKPTGNLSGHFGRLGFMLTASHRETSNFYAPAGTFGSLHLDGKTLVHDTGVTDGNYTGMLSYGLAEHQRLFAKISQYSADNAGFGYVDAASIGRPDDPFIRIQYPSQRVTKLSVGYEVTALNSVLADRISLNAYHLRNKRDLSIDVFVPFGAGTPPGAGVSVQSANFTNIATDGFRVEIAKVLGAQVLTYGVDFARDGSDNTDSSATAVVGFGPPQTQISNTPQVPNARFRSMGAFLQGEFALTNQLTAVLGGRIQDVTAATQDTPGLTAPLVSSGDTHAVGSANLIFAATPDLNLIAAVGSAFRAPNLVERFFNGPTPEGSGYQLQTPNLKPETSVNLDLGARWRHEWFSAEAFYFRNTIHDGIRIQATGDTIQGFPTFQNVNVDQIRDEGVELSAEAASSTGVSVRGGFTHLTSTNVSGTDQPTGDSFSTKITGEIRYTDPGSRFWLAYQIRHNGERKDVDLGSSPVGAVLPAFTLQNVMGGVRLFQHNGMTHSITAAVTNLGNVLYAEFTNVSFFRPEPKRGVLVSYRLDF